MSDRGVSDDEIDTILRVAHFCRSRFRGWCRTPADYEDLTSVAAVGALKALRTFDPGRGELEQHLFIGARSEIISYLRTGQLDGIRRVRVRGRTRRCVATIVIDFYARDGEDDTEWRTRKTRDPMTQSVEYDLDTYCAHREFRRGLRDRDRRIIELLESGCTHAEISEEIGLAKSQVGRDARRVALAYAAYMAA